MGGIDLFRAICESIAAACVIVLAYKASKSLLYCEQHLEDIAGKICCHGTDGCGVVRWLEEDAGAAVRDYAVRQTSATHGTREEGSR